ncbi:DUF2865 domain-containing protein [Aquabacter spiritensis]|uniref:Uncharacterized protein DUF2865 n=1 Tax=Aquabacter spiritensis TaxID=933073 RepID=A0A4R3M6H4_9HYPH|nr:DUF2865 domain-containing protein [Aquabacter spiritensis]TCT08203.1 uncharacterized protein DUF2865 [Aquabacter spiritensis]
MRTAIAIRGLFAAVSVATLGAVPAAAQTPADFFAALFGGLVRQAPPQVAALPSVAVPVEPQESARPSRRVAYCVRMCDGRYFPLSDATPGAAEAQCAAFCPKAPSEVFRGSGASIEGAYSDAGLAYGDIPNAYVYRTRLDQACTCTGNGPLGVAAIPIKQDETLRTGDLVMTADGARVFQPKSGAVPHDDTAFVLPEDAKRLSRDMKQRIEDLQIAARPGRPGG